MRGQLSIRSYLCSTAALTQPDSANESQQTNPKRWKSGTQMSAQPRWQTWHLNRHLFPHQPKIFIPPQLPCKSGSRRLELITTDPDVKVRQRNKVYKDDTNSPRFNFTALHSPSSFISFFFNPSAPTSRSCFLESISLCMLSVTNSPAESRLNMLDASRVWSGIVKIIKSDKSLRGQRGGGSESQV